MHFPPPDLPPERTPEPPALVSVVARSDVMWNRPIFKAPPLVVNPPQPKDVVEELRRGIRHER